MHENEQGQLFVSVKESRKLKARGVGAFCIFQLEKQQIRTRAVYRSNNPEFSYESFDEGYTFDVTSSTSVLNIAVWATQQTILPDSTVDNSVAMLVASLSIPVIALSHKKPIDQWFKMNSYDPSDKEAGEIHLKLHYTTTTRKVGVDDFQLLKVVGTGTFAKVMMVRKKDTNRLYAMKVLSKEDVIRHNAVQHTIAERNVLKRINHPFIVSLKYSFQTEEKLYMILDYICGGELFYHLSEAERFSEDRARFYAAEIILALEYLHKMNVVYRDLKPENLLLDMNGHICLTDFGLCKEGLGFGHVTHTFCGSPEYLAPEIFLGRGYSYSVDWWALGTLLYEMLSGLPPFFSDDVQEMNERILTEKLSFPSYFSANARGVLSGLLDRNPQTRLGSGKGDAAEIKQHPFFQSVDWSKLEKRQIQAPFRPALRSETDVRFFDPDSTRMIPSHESVNNNNSRLTKQEQDAFLGFSYVAPDVETFRRMRRRGSSSSSSRNQSSTENSPTFSGFIPPTKSGIAAAVNAMASPQLKGYKDPSHSNYQRLSFGSSTSSSSNTSPYHTAHNSNNHSSHLTNALSASQQQQQHLLGAQRNIHNNNHLNNSNSGSGNNHLNNSNHAQTTSNNINNSNNNNNNDTTPSVEFTAHMMQNLNLTLNAMIEENYFDLHGSSDSEGPMNASRDGPLKSLPISSPVPRRW